MEDKREISNLIQRRVLEKVDYYRDINDEELMRKIDEEIYEYKKERYLTVKEREVLKNDVYNALRKLDVLQDLIDDPTITEIMVNGPDRIFIERGGKLIKTDLYFNSVEKLEEVIQQIVGRNNRAVNVTNPIADARLENGARVNIMLPPVAINGPIMTIRRFPDKPITIDQLIAWGSINSECAEFLEKLVISGYNIFVSGGTGSGKTTLLNVLSGFIPRDKRIITIEDNAELRIMGVENLVSLEARNATVEGEHEITIRDLLKASLRSRPDRIIVGEIRGAEAIDMIQSANTGHQGLLSTGHANSPRDMLNRMETMIMMGIDLPIESIRRQIASGLEILVHTGRLRDKSRKVLEVTEITGYKNGEIQLNCLYKFEEGGEKNGKIKGELKKKGALVNREKLALSGIDL